MTATAATRKIRSRDRAAIIQSLRAGVVPRRGQQHIQVGRAPEIEALLADLQRIEEAGSAIRFVIGDYGSGKTFFLFLVRSIALEMGLVTAHADLAPDRRLQATGGQARALYAELMANLSTRTKPDGGALASVVERFITMALQEARKQAVPAQRVIQERLHQLSEMPGGYDFAEVVAAYWKGHDEDNDRLQSNAVRWLRGEYSTRTDARAALGVRSIIDDSSFYDHLKLLAHFVRLAGYGGLLVALDEMVNLYKLTHTKSRTANYEQLLRIVNDSLQGVSVGLGFLFGGTPEFLMDHRRGLYSYEALRSRLQENTFATAELRDFSGPVLRLSNLTPEELFVLLDNLRNVFAAGDSTQYLVPDDALHAFMSHCSERVGNAYFRTPRNTIKAFVDLLSVLEQNPSASWAALLPRVAIDNDEGPSDDPLATDSEQDGEEDELTSFRI